MEKKRWADISDSDAEDSKEEFSKSIWTHCGGREADRRQLALPIFAGQLPDCSRITSTGIVPACSQIRVWIQGTESTQKWPVSLPFNFLIKIRHRHRGAHDLWTNFCPPMRTYTGVIMNSENDMARHALPVCDKDPYNCNPLVKARHYSVSWPLYCNGVAAYTVCLHVQSTKGQLAGHKRLTSHPSRLVLKALANIYLSQVRCLGGLKLPLMQRLEFLSQAAQTLACHECDTHILMQFHVAAAMLSESVILLLAEKYILPRSSGTRECKYVCNRLVSESGSGRLTSEEFAAALLGENVHHSNLNSEDDWAGAWAGADGYLKYVRYAIKSWQRASGMATRIAEQDTNENSKLDRDVADIDRRIEALQKILKSSECKGVDSGAVQTLWLRHLERFGSDRPEYRKYLKNIARQEERRSKRSQARRTDG